jgi:hypothetical protein
MRTKGIQELSRAQRDESAASAIAKRTVLGAPLLGPPDPSGPGGHRFIISAWRNA